MSTNVWLCMYVCLHASMYDVCMESNLQCVYVHICMYVCIYACMHAIYILYIYYIYIYIYTRARTHTHIAMNTCIHARTGGLRIPITVKIRVYDDEDKTLRYAKMVQDAGAQVCLYGFVHVRACLHVFSRLCVSY